MDYPGYLRYTIITVELGKKMRQIPGETGVFPGQDFVIKIGHYQDSYAPESRPLFNLSNERCLISGI
ncbi:MAG: hypothetical protein MI799_11385 [Desulfobacterales bacterium]|nr:hypothetical protein [Desulfobacterales bacterium]